MGRVTCTEHVEKVGNRSSRRRNFPLWPSAPPIRSQFSTPATQVPIFAFWWQPTLHPHTSSSVVVTTFRHRLPTLDDDDDPLQQGYPSPFKADKKETGRWPNSSRFSARIIDNSAQSQTKYQFTFRILWYEFIKIKQKNRKQQVYVASSFKGIASLIHSDVIPGNLNAKQALFLEIDCRELQAGGSKDADSVLQTVVKRIATYLCEKQYWRFRVRFRDEWSCGCSCGCNSNRNRNNRYAGNEWNWWVPARE